MAYEHNGCAGCAYESPCCDCHGTELVGCYDKPDLYSPFPRREEKDSNISERAKILREAEKNICGQREQDYGSPEDNFGIIAKLWTDYTGTLITSQDVAMMMVLLKVARIKNGGGSGDSFVDIAGYAACGGEIWRGTSAQ